MGEVFRLSEKQEGKGKRGQSREEKTSRTGECHRDPKQRGNAMKRAFEGWREERILHRERKREVPEFVFVVFGFPL